MSISEQDSTSHLPGKALETERLWLRPITVEDAGFYVQLMNSPKWLAYIGDRQIYTEEACRVYIEERMLPQWTRLGYGNYIAWRKEDNVPIGAVGIFSRPGLDHVDLGFAFLPAYEKQGYASEGSRRLLQEAWDVFRLEQLQAITSPENTDCQRLLNKLGFESMGSVTLPNATSPDLLYRLLSTSK